MIISCNHGIQEFCHSLEKKHILSLIGTYFTSLKKDRKWFFCPENNYFANVAIFFSKYSPMCQSSFFFLKCLHYTWVLKCIFGKQKTQSFFGKRIEKYNIHKNLIRKFFIAVLYWSISHQCHYEGLNVWSVKSYFFQFFLHIVLVVHS